MIDDVGLKKKGGGGGGGGGGGDASLLTIKKGLSLVGTKDVVVIIEWVSTEWMALLIRCLTTFSSPVSPRLVVEEQVSDSPLQTQTRAS